MSDPLHTLLQRRTGLVHDFIRALEALDMEIGVAQRHHLQTQAAAMLTAPYEALTEADAQQREETRTVLAAFRAYLESLQRELRDVHTDLAAHQAREEAGVAALRQEVAALATERRAVGDELRQAIAALTEDVAHLRERGA